MEKYQDFSKNGLTAAKIELSYDMSNWTEFSNYFLEKYNHTLTEPDVEEIASFINKIREEKEDEEYKSRCPECKGDGVSDASYCGYSYPCEECGGDGKRKADYGWGKVYLEQVLNAIHTGGFEYDKDKTWEWCSGGSRTKVTEGAARAYAIWKNKNKNKENK